MIAEYSFLPVPQMEMSIYIGISSTSQKMKNRRRSREQNTPRMPVSSTRSQAKYSLTLRSIFHDTSTATRPIKVVRITKGRLNPSTPIKYWTSIAGIHDTCSTNWGPSSERSNMEKRASDNINDTAAKAAAVSFICLWLAPSRAMTIAPIRGRKIITDR